MYTGHLGETGSVGSSAVVVVLILTGEACVSPRPSRRATNEGNRPTISFATACACCGEVS